MARLEIISVNYSRESGMASISGRGFYSIAKLMEKSAGIDCVEYDEEEGSITICFNKSHFDVDGFKDLYKKSKDKLSFDSHYSK